MTELSDYRRMVEQPMIDGYKAKIESDAKEIEAFRGKLAESLGRELVQQKVIASITLHNDKLHKSLQTALNLLSRGVLVGGHTSRAEWDSFLDAWEIEARSLLSDEQTAGENK